MTNIVCELRICSNISTESYLYRVGQLTPNDMRLTQIVSGLTEFFKYNSKHIDSGKMDVYVTDNTIPDDMSLNKQILDVIHPKCKIIACLNNNYGCYNKGAGDIEQWKYCQEKHQIFDNYKWFIHFEPRLFLKDNTFIDSFMETPRELFTYAPTNSIIHFNTGLFAIHTPHMLDFINKVSLNWMVKNIISIEHILYNYFKNKNIKFDTIEKMNVIWHDWSQNGSFDM